METGEALEKIAVYLREHDGLALRYVPEDVELVDGGGYWEIILVTGFIRFEKHALSSDNLPELASQLPNR